MRFCFIVVFIFSVARTWAAPTDELSKPEPESKHICNHIYLKAGQKLSLSKNERKIVCGDEQYPSWERIPLNQAEYFLKPFLESRAYYHYKIRREEDYVHLDLGSRTYISSISLEGVRRKVLNIKKMRGIEGQLMTSAQLDRIESWVGIRLQMSGYPCPKVSLRANADTGHIKVNVKAGQLSQYPETVERELAGIERGVLKRYWAFDKGDDYSLIKNTLSSRRTLADGIVQNTHLSARCEDNQSFEVHQTLVAGEPRVFMAGVGANTEGLLLFRSSMRLHRIDPAGSNINLQLFLSLREQTFESNMNWYLFKTGSPWFIRPEFRISRENEPQYEVISSRLQMGPSRRWDSQNAHWNLNLAPRFTWNQTEEGNQLGESYFLSAIAQLEIMTHRFEYYRAEPQAGQRYRFSLNLNHDALLSDQSVQLFEFTGESLWNMGQFHPPFLVGGIRWALRTSLTDSAPDQVAQLPPTFLHYLGGSRDLRGFSRGELPLAQNNQTGALSAAYLGSELRLAGGLPLNLQPFIFLDAGLLSLKSFELAEPLYLSPGLGVRWKSPIGPVRVSYGRGYTWGEAPSSDLTHGQFYFSLGEEF